MWPWKFPSSFNLVGSTVFESYVFHFPFVEYILQEQRQIVCKLHFLNALILKSSLTIYWPEFGDQDNSLYIFHALHVLCSSIQSYSLQVSWQSDSHPLARELLYLSESFDVLFSVPVILWGCIQASSCWGLYLVFSSRNVEYHFLSPLSSLFLKLLLIKQWLSWITIRSSRFQILYILYFLSLRPSLPFERFSQLELLVSHWMSNFSHHSISESSFFSDCTIL